MESKKWSKPTKPSMPTLPQELITEILLRVPVKPLLQFRCVSKSWLALISSPEFVKTHLRLSTSNNKENTHHMLALSTSPTSSYEYIFQDCTVKSLLYEPVTVELDFDYPMDGLSEILFNNSIKGSVHGLICLKPKRHDLFLWNPSIKKYKKLPGCKPTLMSDASLYGFGYDEFHDDYKVVVIFSRDDNLDQVEVKIYSLTSDSWKNVDGYPGGMPYSVSVKFVNGKLHWTTLVPCINDVDNLNIISINLADEKWGKVELPSYEEGYDFVWLDVLGSDLSFFRSYLRAHIDAWVMKEYGVKESWTKMFTIEYSVDFRLIPSCFMSNTGCGHVSGVHPITTAKVPILKVIDCGTKVECDISVENRDGVSKSKIIYLICSLDERFQKLSFLMKAWAKAQNINSSKDKTLNSLSIILLVAFHLQTRNPPILPPFSAILEDGSDPDAVAKSLNKFVNYGKKNKESVAELLVTLLIKLSSVEKLWAKGLCASTYEAAWLSKTWDSKVCCISVEDFTDRSQNVARAVGKGEVKRIYKCIQRTSEYISAFMDGLVEIPTLRSHLFGRLAPFQVGSQTRDIEENGHTFPLPCKDINNKDDQSTESEKQSQGAIPSEPIMTTRKWSTEGWEALPSEPSVTKRKWSTEGWEGLPSASWGQSKEDGVPPDSPWTKRQRSDETPEGTAAQWSRKSDTKGWFGKKHANKCAPVAKWANMQTGGRGESQESTEGGWEGLPSASWGQSKEDGVPLDSLWTKKKRSEETPEGTSTQWSRKSDTKGWSRKKHAKKCAPAPKWANLQTGARGES